MPTAQKSIASTETTFRDLSAPKITVTVLNKDYSFSNTIDLLFYPESKLNIINNTGGNRKWICFHKEYGLLEMKFSFPADKEPIAHVTKSYQRNSEKGKTFKLLTDENLAILFHDFDVAAPKFSSGNIVCHEDHGLCKVVSIPDDLNLLILPISGKKTLCVKNNTVIQLLENTEKEVILKLDKVSLTIPNLDPKPQKKKLKKLGKKQTPLEATNLKPQSEIANKNVKTFLDNGHNPTSEKSFGSIEKPLELAPKTDLRSTPNNTLARVIETHSSVTSDEKGNPDILSITQSEPLEISNSDDSLNEVQTLNLYKAEEETKIPISDDEWPSDVEIKEKTEIPTSLNTIHPRQRSFVSPNEIKDFNRNDLQHILAYLLTEGRYSYVSGAMRSFAEDPLKQKCLTLISPLIECIESRSGKINPNQKIDRRDPVINRAINLIDNILVSLRDCSQLTDKQVSAVAQFPFKEIINHATSKTLSMTLFNATSSILGMIAKKIFDGKITPKEGAIKANLYLAFLNNPPMTKTSNRSAEINKLIINELGLNP